MLCKENYKSSSCCIQKEGEYDYQGISNAVCGRTRYYENDERKGKYFTPLRIMVIKMEMTEEQKRI